ncbi:MAG: hypothetical protein JWP15_1729 [Alphaproteobacteria bacterium]|nr:hypothetical protein [Alphaproteobacteria bacterium]
MASQRRIELTVRVSNNNSGVKQYGFAFDQDSKSPDNPVEPVLMGLCKGTFHTRPGVIGRLVWAMRGDPGGTMKVELVRDGVVIKARAASRIPPRHNKAIDHFDIMVS